MRWSSCASDSVSYVALLAHNVAYRIRLELRAATLMLRHFSFYCRPILILTASRSFMKQAVGLFLALSVRDAILACPFE
jgi:hypothetical protein